MCKTWNQFPTLVYVNTAKISELEPLGTGKIFELKQKFDLAHVRTTRADGHLVNPFIYPRSWYATIRYIGAELCVRYYEYSILCKFVITFFKPAVFNRFLLVSPIEGRFAAHVSLPDVKTYHFSLLSSCQFKKVYISGRNITDRQTHIELNSLKSHTIGSQNTLYHDSGWCYVPGQNRKRLLKGTCLSS